LFLPLTNGSYVFVFFLHRLQIHPSISSWPNGPVVFFFLISSLDYINKMKEDVLKQMHNSIVSGHLGNKKTKEKIKQRFYWFEMREDIRIWISKCEICASIKPLHRRHSRLHLGVCQLVHPPKVDIILGIYRFQNCVLGLSVLTRDNYIDK
jgi:hypothetical protein